MKFSLFLHMERSDPAKPHKELFDELVELTLMAEKAGFETVWIGEHHMMEFTICPNPLNFMAYLAPITKTIRLGLGTIVAPFWNPVRLASEASLVDMMSNGRLDFGIARGAYQSEFDRMTDGMTAKEGGGPLREMIPALQKLWTGDYAHDGTHYSFPTSTAIPRVTQKPFPPMWVAAREQESHDYAVKSDCNVMITPLIAGDASIELACERFKQACVNNPDKPAPQLLALRHTWVHEEDEDWSKGAQALRDWYAYFYAWFKNDQDPVDGFVKPLTDAQMDELPGFGLDDLHKNLLIGTPTQVTKRIKHYEALGITQFSFWSDNGLPHAEKKKSLQLFIDKVMPNFN
jgi:alkanesulfonate monooxygenase SsuD/methylene tetrahydromethanopterin reductase-like flavin-dependent oxidoreductase (luciferase family)